MFTQNNFIQCTCMYLINLNCNIYPILFHFADINPFYDSCVGLNEIQNTL